VAPTSGAMSGAVIDRSGGFLVFGSCTAD
jgi:hypothetical protein